jgi:hypothetical protein
MLHVILRRDHARRSVGRKQVMTLNTPAPRATPPYGRLIALVVALACVGYGLYWGWQTAQHARALRAHAQSLRALKPAQLGAAGPLLRAMGKDVALLRADLRLPLAIAPYLGWLPRIGPTLRAAPPLLDAGEALLAASATAVEVFQEPLQVALSDPSRALPLLRVQSAAHAARLEEAARLAGQASDTLVALDAAALWPPLGEPLAQAQPLVPLLRAAFEALPLLPRLLPAEKQTYLLLAQNSDELRPTGGFLSSLATLTLANGLPQIGPFEDTYQLEDWGRDHPNPPEPLRQHMGLDLWTTRDANWWPDFPVSARAVITMYQLNRDIAAQGIIAADMVAAARLVAALAPLRLPSGETLGRDQVEQRFRESWGLPPGRLVTSGVVITASKPFTAIELTLAHSNIEGQVWFDAVVLEDLRQPQHNLVANPSFETSADGRTPDGWRVVGLGAADGLTTTYAHSGERSWYAVGDKNQAKTLTQRIARTGQKGERFRLAAESRAENVSTQGGPCALLVTILYADGQSETTLAPFPPLSHDWATAGSVTILGEWWAHRKDVVNQVVAAALQQMLATPEQVRWPELLTALAVLLQERHIQLYSADAALQGWLERQGWAGTLGRPQGDYLLVVDSNTGYNKVNVNISQTLEYACTLDASGAATGRLAIRYVNQSIRAVAQCDKFTQYVPSYDLLTQGCYWDYVRVYVPAGATLRAAVGGDASPTTTEEGAFTVFATALLLRPGEERILRLEYALPPGMASGDRYTLHAHKQGGTVALPLQVSVTTPGRLAVEPGSLAPRELLSNSALFLTDLRVDREIALRLK